MAREDKEVTIMQAAISMNAYQNNQVPMDDPFKSSYQENQVYTATKEELILMLYDGALKFIRGAGYALEESNIPQLGYNILRAQKIIHYLDMTLNLDEGKEIAENLTKLYDYINRRLFDGQRQKSAEPLEEAIKIIETLREGWFMGVVQKSE